MSETKFFVCKHCGNLIGMIENSGVPIVCCGEKMTELVANTVDASLEKHTPVVNVNGDKVEVTVGSVEHPMLDEHFIKWIYLETKKGGQRKSLKPGEAPKATFAVADDEPVAVYAYCNLHGLWKTVI
ncbi:MAG TPA: desulfoferrodoxin [Lachnospiraceae bacterium]|nr:desulfoferrodoxin [Lachnospiraceae bacterium]